MPQLGRPNPHQGRPGTRGGRRSSRRHRRRGARPLRQYAGAAEIPQIGGDRDRCLLASRFGVFAALSQSAVRGRSGRRALSTPGDGDHRRAVAAVHGSAVAGEMVEARHQASESLSVEGLVSQPRLSRGNRDAVLLAVNGRPVVSRALGYALEECYAGRLERGRFPIAVLEVRVDPARVDVNVHPAKREVRFHEEGVVFAAVQQVLRAALAGAEAYRLPVAATAVAAPAPPAPVVHTPRVEIGAEPALVAASGLLRPLGQVMDGYLVAEGREGIVLVDQHAAHERVLYNRFLGLLTGATATVQPLLIPVQLEVGPEQAAAASDHAGELRALGFEIEEFGPRTLRVNAAPAETPSARIGEATEDLLATLARSGAGNGDSRSSAAASLACHSAVRFGDRLDPAEQRRLLEELEKADDAVTCPHGRPTRLIVEWQDL